MWNTRNRCGIILCLTFGNRNWLCEKELHRDVVTRRRKIPFVAVIWNRAASTSENVPHSLPDGG
jgi:hypothetical protein